MSEEIELENGLRVEINTKELTAKVIKSPNVTGTVIVPRFAISENKKYKIISIGDESFYGVKFDSLIFAEDSEVESFEGSTFFCASFNKLQIPPKLKKLSCMWCYFIRNLIDIEISPKNELFSFIDNKYLIGKSNADSDVFDILYYARYDIEEAVIPPQIEILHDNSFCRHPKLKSVICPTNSKLKRIEDSSFYFSTISKLVLPETLEFIHCDAFNETNYLNEIEISPKNKLFSVIEKTLVVKKSDMSSKDFDILIFCRRDAENVKIPSYVKVLDEHAFHNCDKLKSITFGPESSLQKINKFAIYVNQSIKLIIFPPSLNYLESCCISNDNNLEYVQFLGEYIKIAGSCFNNCCKGMILSFPNAKKLEFDKGSISNLPEGSKLKIRRGAELVGDEFLNIQARIDFIDESEVSNQKVHSPTEKDKNGTSSNSNKNDENYKEQISRCMKRIRFLESRLQRYEDVVPFDPNSKSSDEDHEIEIKMIEYDEEKDTKKENKNIFIDDEEESHQRVICQIGEGATSVTYKVIDEQRDEELCKKVLKAEEGQTTFNDVRNIYKEFEVLAGMNHPSICKVVGLNPQEKLSADKNSIEQDDEDEIEIKSDFASGSTTEHKSKTTIAIFLKFHPMNLRQCLERDILNNTLKAKLAVETAFGMLHIHEHGMIHRDLKLENVMVNYIFEAQLIDFGLAHVDAMKNTMTSMTKGIGTLAYMSPEMSNEEEYDNKTDVYSFGVLLFVLFTRRFPKQNLKEKLTNKPIKFPEPSPAISSFTISLIKKCMSFESQKRPSFADIVSEMYNHSFKMAEGVDSDIVLHRFKALNRFRALHKRSKTMPVKEPSQPKSNSKLPPLGNRKPTAKPVIKKPI